MWMKFPGEEAKTTHLMKLSDEVSRIAGELARLSSEDDATELSKKQSAPIDIDQVRSVIRSRALRSKFFCEEIFADPAWDILLDLFAAEIQQFRVQVSRLAATANVPQTTLIRWINVLVVHDLVVRRPDQFDGRRVFIELSSKASEAMRRYFGHLNGDLTI